MNPTVDEILATFISICPDFWQQWEAETADWTDEYGPTTYCRVFLEITGFVRQKFGQMPAQQQKQLMDFIESCTIADANEDKYDDLDNAVCTCLLENLAGEPPLSAQLRKYMGPNSLAFFERWDYPRGD